MPGDGGNAQIARSLPIRRFQFVLSLSAAQKLNAMNGQFFEELADCFQRASADSDSRAVVLAAAGRHFSAGLDMKDLTVLQDAATPSNDPARKGLQIRVRIACCIPELPPPFHSHNARPRARIASDYKSFANSR